MGLVGGTTPVPSTLPALLELDMVGVLWLSTNVVLEEGSSRL